MICASRPKNDVGFSLVEILIVLGIMSVLVAGMTSFITNIGKSSQKVSNRMYENMFMNDINSIFSDREACKTAVGISGQTPLNLSAPWKLKMQMPGYPVLQEGSTVQSSFVMEQFYMDSFTLPIAAGSGKMKTAGTLWAKTSDLQTNSIPRRLKAIGSFSLYYDSATGVVESCNGTVVSPASEICLNLGYAWNSTTSKCDINPSPSAVCLSQGGTWNSTTSKCAPAGQETCTAQGGFWNSTTNKCAAASKETCEYMGFFWNGSNCIPVNSTTCTSMGGTWNVTYCSFPGAPTGPVTTFCPAGTTTSCTAGNGSGTKTCNATGSAYGSCNLTSCNSGYTLSGGSCVAASACTPYSSQSCSVANGTGSQTCAANGSSFGACTATACNSGYTLSGGACVAAAAAASCTAPWGATVASGSSVDAWSSIWAKNVGCPGLKESRTCTNGTLSGSNTKNYCQANCAFAGAEFQNNWGYWNDLTSSAYTLCSNGTWSSVDLGTYAPSYSCDWGGKKFNSGACGVSGGVIYTCQSGTWQSGPAADANCP